VSQPASGFARTLAALREAGVEFVVVSVGGINFYARTGALVRVGRLDKLLRSKERSGRAKDREFLRAFKARGSDEELD